ncbi:MAG: COX15/CtaA family protein [Bacteroidota bacterium]
MRRLHNVQRSIWLHRFAVFTAVCTFLLIVAGGLVTSTDSGLAVPDWPLSYGQIMPPMVGGIFYEHGHRMVATFVGFLTTILAFWIWRVDDRRWVRTLGWTALAAVIAQGVLGGITVLFLLPTPISVAHATLAQSFFCLTIVLALVTSPSWRVDASPVSDTIGHTRTLSLWTTGAVFLQLILGAIMRHTESGLAIPDFPLSYGGIIPPTDPGTISDINAIRLADDLRPIVFAQMWIHFAHRVGAILVSVVLLFHVRRVLHYYSDSGLREPAIIQSVLLVFQILLGALTVWNGKSVEVTTAHVAVGALLLGISALVTVRTYSLYRLPEREPEPMFAPEPSRS